MYVARNISGFEEWFEQRGYWSTEYELCKRTWHAALEWAAQFHALAMKEGYVKYPWAWETMQIINKLTPNIKGKAFDPDWFLLRQRLEQFEEKAKSHESSR